MLMFMLMVMPMSQCKPSFKESSIHWYLPPHPVTSPTKLGKVRIVLDAAAEFEATSLNKNPLSWLYMTNS